MSTVQAQEQQLLIGGEWVRADGGRTFEKNDPYTGEPATVAAAAAIDDAERAVAAAAAAFPEWSALSASKRSDLLTAAADLLMERAPEIAQTMTEECGAVFGWGMFNCDLAAGMLRTAAAQADLPERREDIPSNVPGLSAMAVRQPVGVVVGIAPWNAPVILATRAVAT